MIRRLYKEFQIIRIPFIAAVLSVPLTLLITEDSNLRWNIPIIIQLLFCAIMGSAIFGREFEHGAMEKLLAQPVKRIRIWREKILVLALCYGGMALVNLINPVYYLPRRIEGVFLPYVVVEANINETRSFILNFIIPVGLLSSRLFLSSLHQSLQPLNDKTKLLIDNGFALIGAD